EPRVLGGAGDADLVVLLEAGAQDRALPVGILLVGDGFPLEVAEDLLVGTVRIDGPVRLATVLDVLRSVHHADQVQRALHTGVAVVRDLRLAGAARVRGDEHDAVRAAAAIDRRRRRVLQDLDRRDVRRVEVLDAAGDRNTVD